jgi:hypothetical protein
MFRSQLKGGIVLAAALVGSLGSAVANADENVSSANYMLPLCKTWLKVNVEHDRDEIKHILTTDPVQFTSSGMCAGFVIGVTETLRVARVSCPLMASPTINLCVWWWTKSRSIPSGCMRTSSSQ